MWMYLICVYSCNLWPFVKLPILVMKPEKRNPRKGSVLVVDDEEIMREVLETLLSNEGYRVDLAKTGEEGLEAYGRRAYDVVLLDVSMPGIGGLRALEEFLKMDLGCGNPDDHRLRDFRHRDRCVGTRRVRLHQKAFPERTDHAQRSPPELNDAGKKKNVAPSAVR